MEGNHSRENSMINLAETEKTVALKLEILKEISAIKKAFAMLDRIPTHLKYHVKGHTEDVLHETVLFAVLAARSIRQEQKEANILALEQEISDLESRQ